MPKQISDLKSNTAVSVVGGPRPYLWVGSNHPHHSGGDFVHIGTISGPAKLRRIAYAILAEVGAREGSPPPKRKAKAKR